MLYGTLAGRAYHFTILLHFAIDIKSKYIIFRKAQRAACKGSKSRSRSLATPVLYNEFRVHSAFQDQLMLLKNPEYKKHIQYI